MECSKSTRANVLSDVINDILAVDDCSYTEFFVYKNTFDLLVSRSEIEECSYLYYSMRYAELHLSRLEHKLVQRALRDCDPEVLEDEEMMRRFHDLKAFADTMFPYWIEGDWRTSSDEDSDEAESSVLLPPPLSIDEQRREKFRRKNLRRRERRREARDAYNVDMACIHIAMQSGGRTADKGEETPTALPTGRARREKIQREKAELKKKLQLREEYSRKKTKTRDLRRQKMRDAKVSRIELQSGLYDFLTFPYRATKSVVTLPMRVSNVTNQLSIALGDANDPDGIMKKAISDASEAVTKIGDAAEKANSLLAELSDPEGPFRSSLNSICGNINSASTAVAENLPEAAVGVRSMIETITDALTNMRETLLTKIPEYLVNTLMAGFLFYAIIKFESPFIKAAIAGLTGLLFAPGLKTLLDELFKEVMGAVDFWRPSSNGDDPEIEQQSGASHFPLIAKVVGTAMVGTFFVTKKGGPKGLLTHIIATLAVVPRTYKGLESIMEAIVDMTESGFNIIRAWFKLPPIVFANKFGKILDQLAQDVYEFEYKVDTKTTGMKPVVQYTHIMGLQERVKVQMLIHSSDRELREMLNSLKRILLRIGQPLKHTAGQDIGYRCQPASVVIAGRPGIGKTAMTMTIALTIMKLCGAIQAGASAEEASQSVFTKPYNSPYMDGYNGQFAYLIDDLFAIKPNPNSESTAFADVMTFYGSYTAMLDMAECEKKGMFPFTSKLLLMTTNCRDLTAACASSILLDESAFRRRIDFHVEIIVKKPYRKPNSHELDPAKYAEEMVRMRDADSLDVFPWHIWEYFETTFDGASSIPDSGGRPLKELLIRVAERIKLNQVYHENNMDMMDKVVKATIDESWSGVSVQSGSTGDVCAVPELPEGPKSGSGGEEGGSDTDEETDDISPLDEGASASNPTDIRELSPADAASVEIYMSEWRPPGLREISTQTGERYDLTPSPLWLPSSSEMADNDYTMKLMDRLKERMRKYPSRYEKDLSLVHEVLRRRFEMRKQQYDWKGKVVRYWNMYLDKDTTRMLKMMTIGICGSLAIMYAITFAQSTYRWLKKLIFGGKKNKKKIETQSNGPKPRPREIKFVNQQSGGEVFGAWYSVYKNTYKAAIKLTDGNYSVLGQIVFVKKNLAMMPCHFLDDIRGKVATGEITPLHEIELRSCSSRTSYRVFITVKDFFTYPIYNRRDRDLVFIDFKGALRPHKDIVKFFLRSSEIDDIGGSAVRLDTARMDKDGELIDFNERVTYISPTVEVGTVPQRIGETTHTRWLRYLAETRSGDCGAVLSLTDTTAFSCRFVIGIHIGYDRVWNKAYATPVDSELCTEAINHLHVDDYVEGVVAQSGWEKLGISTEEIDEIPFADASGGFGSFEPMLSIQPAIPTPISSNLRPTPFKKTEFFKEEIAGFYGGKEPETLAVMKLGSYKDAEGNLIFPMLQALKPYAGSVRIIDQVSFRRAVDVALHPFSIVSRHFVGRILTFDEAVIGVPAMGLKSIARQTSVGFPWCAATGGVDKSYFFGKGQEFDLSTANSLVLEKEVAELETMLKDGIRPMFVCRDFLKDEVRKEGKNARLIAGTDIRYYILCRMYFGAYVAAMIKLHRHSGVCVGMNQYTEWEWLKQHLLKAGDKVWDGDFAGFDESQQPSMLWPILEHINEWYSLRGGRLDNPVRTLLFYDLAHSRHLVSAGGGANTVVQWSKSLPSGHFLTSTVNSILSMSCIVSAFIATTGELDFWSHASVATQGDDNICSTSDEFIDRFNQVTVSDHLKKSYGMTYTAGRKGEELKPFMKIEDVIFLQRRFAVKNGHVVCPIRPESFLNSLYYTKKGSKLYKEDVIITGLENALQELAMHDEEHWKRVSPKLVEALSRYGRVPCHSVETSEAYFEVVRNRVPDYL